MSIMMLWTRSEISAINVWRKLKGKRDPPYHWKLGLTNYHLPWRFAATFSSGNIGDCKASKTKKGRMRNENGHKRLNNKPNEVERKISKVYLLSPGQTIATCQLNISQHCWAQHVACVWPPCCDMLRRVGCWPFSNLSQQHPTCRNTSQHGDQTNTTCCAQQCCDMLCWHVAIVWPGLYAWPNKNLCKPLF